MADSIEQVTVASTGSTKFQDKGVEKNEKSISWLDDGKNSNLIALAEATLEVRPYLSTWGDIQQKWNEVARLLGDRKAIPAGKNFRAVQGKMKDLLDQLQRFQDDLKKPNLSMIPRSPFSEKLLRLLTQVQEQSTSSPVPRAQRKRESESRRDSGGQDEDSDRKVSPVYKRRRALEEKMEQAYQEKEAELRRLKEETLRIEAMRRELEAKMKMEEDRRKSEREVESATLDLLRQVLTAVDKLRSREK